jgi:hypothetical protein
VDEGGYLSGVGVFSRQRDAHIDAFPSLDLSGRAAFGLGVDSDYDIWGEHTSA